MCRTKLFFAPLLSFILAASLRLHAATSVGELRCEHLENPQGIDPTQPRLSWMLYSSERGVKQSAYQILVASNEDKLKSDAADLWDSGKRSEEHTSELQSP